MTEFFSNMNAAREAESRADIDRQVVELKRQLEAAADKKNRQNEELEKTVVGKYRDSVERMARTEETINEIDNLLMHIIDTAQTFEGELDDIGGIEGYNHLGKVDFSKDWIRYDKSYKTGYEIVGNILVLTLNYSRVNSFSSTKINPPNVNWEYLSSALLRKGIVVERIQKEGDSDPSVYTDEIDVLKIYCVGDIYLQERERNSLMMR